MRLDLFRPSWLACVGVVAQALVTPKLSSRDSVNPCSELSSAIAAQLDGNSSAIASVPPSQVLKCFRDVPINSTLAVALVDWLKPFINVQTTINWLKDPPPAYRRPAVDIVGGLDDIASRATNGSYQNEYDFEVDLLALFDAATDIHFSWLPFLPGLLSGGNIDRGAILASVSFDGQQLPQIFFLSDLASNMSSNSTFTPSPLVAIDGQDPMVMLDHVLTYNPGLQDPDAGFNEALYSVTQIVQGDPMGAYATGFDPSLQDSTCYTFQNGTSITLNNTVQLPYLGNLTSGQQIFDLFIAPSSDQDSKAISTSGSSATTTTEPDSSSTSSATAVLDPIFPGFPTPVIAQTEQAISGYFLPQSDTAVLVITSFNYYNSNPDVDPEFERIATEFISLCKDASKTDLIIDLRRNLGGISYLAYDLYGQLFPHHVPFSRTWARAGNETDALGRLISQIPSIPPTNNATLREGLVAANGTFYNYRTGLKAPTGPQYSSWSELYGPVSSHGEIFTNAEALNFNDAVIDEEQANIVESGFANNTNVQSSPFDAAHITVLTDGMCASTCADFVNLLIGEGVNTVAVGGRPSTDQIAIIGGTQGAYAVTFGSFASLAQTAIETAEYLNVSADALQPLVQPPPLQPIDISQCRLNIQDNLSRDQSDFTPLQFTFSPADCRMFYVARDMFDAQYTWQRVAEGVANGGKGLCVNGSLRVPPLNGTATALWQ